MIIFGVLAEHIRGHRHLHHLFDIGFDGITPERMHRTLDFVFLSLPSRQSVD